MQRIRELLMGELRDLERELRIELPKEIQTALAMGDLRENAEYQAALERQGYVKARIGQLRKRLTDLGTINLSRIPRDRVGMGSTVTLLDLGSNEPITYELVFPELADQKKGLISIGSPIGKGLIGKRAGDQVLVRIPSGQKRFEVVELRTLHDKDDEASLS